MLTAQLTEIRRDLAQFPSAALQRACTAVDDARTLPWPRQLQLRRRLMLACPSSCRRYHVQGTCTRQIVSLIVHVEGVKVRARQHERAS